MMRPPRAPASIAANRNSTHWWSVSDHYCVENRAEAIGVADDRAVSSSEGPEGAG
jgi:hypothetical protein